MEELIDAGANVNSWNNFMYSNSPLTWALEKNHLEMAIKLIVAGAHFNQKNNTGNNALNIATKKYNKEVVDNLKKLSLEQKNKVTKDYKNYKETREKINKTDFTSLKEFLSISPQVLLEMGGMHSKYYNNPTFQKQYQEKWLKNTTENNICETEVTTPSTLSSKETSSQLSKATLIYNNQSVSTSANVSEKINSVSNDETNLIQVSTSLQMSTANNSFEKQLLESLPEVPTNNLENTKSRKPIQLST
ncbi:ankyrin repeat domain-containing protein [Spiroplasma sp. AdecLV25b]|uniref:ankyrin repeat domain-containing protein n=1 Tax=Spiroplasma sp. AdecLV25b TaxID=3027162 RepID=UPI0027DEEDC3|nr:ankyrin repeat domain-containing protein [Spiroplasma sp. AdecLV25b]